MKIFDTHDNYCITSDKNRLARIFNVGDIVRVKDCHGLWIVRKFTRRGLPWLRRCDFDGNVLPHIPTGKELQLDDCVCICKRYVPVDLFSDDFSCDSYLVDFRLDSVIRPSGRSSIFGV